MVDIGSYNSDPETYRKLVEDLEARYGKIQLPAEYAHFIQDNLLRLLIRLARYKFVARQLRHFDEVLEVGCGSGLGAIFLSQHCARVVGLDIKADEIQEARSINRRENVTFQCGDLFDMAQPLQFDVVVALDVIEHMPEEQGRRLLKQMAARTRPTGMTIVGTPSLYSLPYQGALSRASHVKCYDQQELVALFDECFGRTLSFSMNDEMVHTGFTKLAWYYFLMGFYPGTPALADSEGNIRKKVAEQ